MFWFEYLSLNFSGYFYKRNLRCYSKIFNIYAPYFVIHSNFQICQANLHSAHQTTESHKLTCSGDGRYFNKELIALSVKVVWSQFKISFLISSCGNLSEPRKIAESKKIRKQKSTTRFCSTGTIFVKLHCSVFIGKILVRDKLDRTGSAFSHRYPNLNSTLSHLPQILRILALGRT